MKPKNLFLLSLIPTFWIGVLALNYYANFDPEWFGVLRELLTIPVILGASVLLVLSLISWRKDGFSVRSLAFYAILLLVVSHTLLFMC